MSVLMMPCVIMARVSVQSMIGDPVVRAAGRVSAEGVRIAQNDRQAAVDRRKHESCRNERAQPQHDQHERHGPVASATGTQPMPLAFHTPFTMPEGRGAIK